MKWIWSNCLDLWWIELEMAETLIGMTESPRTRVTVTPVAQVTGTFRTRSQSSIYSNVSRSCNVRVSPGVMSALESVTQDSHERNRWYVQRMSLSHAMRRDIASRATWVRPIERERWTRSGNGMSHFFLSFFSFLPPSPNIGACRRLASDCELLRLNLRKNASAALHG